VRRDRRTLPEKGESQFREITQQSFDMIYTCYHEGGIAYISPAVLRILGDHVRHPLQEILARADLMEDEERRQRRSGSRSGG
jgi:PAS domain-containing protein